MPNETNATTPTDEEKAKESKREHFKRLAAVRVNAAITACDKLTKLANPALYEYGDEDIAKMEAALTEAVTKATDALKARGKAGSGGFSLD